MRIKWYTTHKVSVCYVPSFLFPMLYIEMGSMKSNFCQSVLLSDGADPGLCLDSALIAWAFFICRDTFHVDCGFGCRMSFPRDPSTTFPLLGRMLHFCFFPFREDHRLLMNPRSASQELWNHSETPSFSICFAFLIFQIGILICMPHRVTGTVETLEHFLTHGKHRVSVCCSGDDDDDDDDDCSHHCHFP